MALYDYLSSGLGVAALAWALRLEAKLASTETKTATQDKANDSLHLEVKSGLADVKAGQVRIEGKLDDFILKFVPGAPPALQAAPLYHELRPSRPRE